MSEQITQNTFNVSILQQDLEQLLKIAGSLVQDITFTLDNEGLTLRTMDPSHVALIDIAMPNSLFEKYQVESEVNIGVHVDEALKVIKQFDKKDSVNMQIKDDNLILSKRELSYKIRLIESSDNNCPLPKIPYDSMVSLNGNDLKKYLSKLNVVSDYLTISLDNNSCIFETNGDLGECKIKLEKGMEEIINLRSTGEFNRSTYSQQYVSEYLKTMSSNYIQDLEFSANNPLRVNSKIFNIGRCHFYLAPRVEN